MKSCDHGSLPTFSGMSEKESRCASRIEREKGRVPIRVRAISSLLKLFAEQAVEMVVGTDRDDIERKCSADDHRQGIQRLVCLLQGFALKNKDDTRLAVGAPVHFPKDP